jgi:hypothetical protein
MKFLIALFILILTYGGQARADCKADCQSEYQSQVNLCRAQYDDPDDADDLKTCMDDAKKEYDSCLEECETEASSTDVRIGDIDDTCIQEIGRTALYNTANAGGGGEKER